MENNLEKIKWSPRIRLNLIKRLYESFAKGIKDIELCDDIGLTLYFRCETFMLVLNNEVKCPKCGVLLKVLKQGNTQCHGNKCDWYTDFKTYWQSIKNYSAWPGRAIKAWEVYYKEFPSKKTFDEKIITIDTLIHSFHIDEKTNLPVKTVASKLFEANRKEAIIFLDNLSAINDTTKDEWKKDLLHTIDKNMVKCANST